MDSLTPQMTSYLIGGAAFLVILSFRMRRMMQLRPFNLQFVWVLPTIFLAMTALTVFQFPPQGMEWAWAGAALVFGAGLGWWRGRLIELSRDPASGQIMARGSAAAMIFIVVLFAIRFALHAALASEAQVVGVRVQAVDVIFLAMALGLFMARAIEMGLRASRLPPITPAVPTT